MAAQVDRRAASSAKVMLAITSQLPWPLRSGGHLRTYYLLRELAKDYQVRLATGTSSADRAEGIAALRDAGVDVRTATIEKPHGRALWGGLLRAVARREPYVLYRRHDQSALRALVRSEIERAPPDFLYLDHLDAFIFRGLAPNIPFVIDFHNVYSKLAFRTSQELRPGPRRWWLRREARLLERVEKEASAQATGIFAVSESERLYYLDRSSNRQVHLVPNGVDCARFRNLPLKKTGQPPIILWLGTMSWEPNVAAAEFLARKVLPQVRARIVDCQLRIVGRSPDHRVTALSSLPGVAVTGEVPSVEPYLAEADVLAVPLEAGGGTRLKILEAFAAGIPVVSTPVGCEGLDVLNGKHLSIAHRSGFAEAISAVLSNASLAMTLAEHARSLCEERFDWAVIGRSARSGLSESLSSARIDCEGFS